MPHEIDFRNENGGPIKRLVWSTDLHFDASDRTQYRLLFDLVNAHEPDAVLIGGDISNGASSLIHLTNLSKKIDKPFYFVLGNHDFYYGSITVIRNEAKKLSSEIPSLHYLTCNGIIPLSEQTALIGHDGWSDAKAGDYFNSDVMLNDYYFIEELKRLNQEERFQKLNELGEEAANYLKQNLVKALETYERVVLLTHVPPFEESCLYEGLPADGNWTPHFVGKATGDAIEGVMKENPNKQLLVLCGHSHWGQDIQILPNLRVVTGHADLGIPNVQGLIFVN
jgi:predicted MPP superfamily phosphohydrolase